MVQNPDGQEGAILGLVQTSIALHGIAGNKSSGQTAFIASDLGPGKGKLTTHTGHFYQEVFKSEDNQHIILEIIEQMSV